MEIQDIEKLAQIMKSADLGEVLVEQGDFRVRLRKEVATSNREVVSYAPMPVAPAGQPLAAPVTAVPTSAPAAGEAGEAPVEEGLHEFVSPMVGTFYRSPSPEADPFVREGAHVSPDTVVCIIEAMKVMNEIRAEMSGEIVRIFIKNGEPIEFGQPLFLVRPA